MSASLVPACTVYTFKIGLICFSTKSRTNKRKYRYTPLSVLRSFFGFRFNW